MPPFCLISSRANFERKDEQEGLYWKCKKWLDFRLINTLLDMISHFYTMLLGTMLVLYLYYTLFVEYLLYNVPLLYNRKNLIQYSNLHKHYSFTWVFTKLIITRWNIKLQVPTYSLLFCLHSYYTNCRAAKSVESDGVNCK